MNINGYKEETEAFIVLWQLEAVFEANKVHSIHYSTDIN